MVVYVFTGLNVVEVVASPKSQSTDVGVGVDVFVNVTGSLTQELAGLIKAACIKFMATAFDFTIVLMQPVLLVTLRLTVKFPCEL